MQTNQKDREAVKGIHCKYVDDDDWRKERRAKLESQGLELDHSSASPERTQGELDKRGSKTGWQTWTGAGLEVGLQSGANEKMENNVSYGNGELNGHKSKRAGT